jgi:hypothetical protein
MQHQQMYMKDWVLELNDFAKRYSIVEQLDTVMDRGNCAVAQTQQNERIARERKIIFSRFST